MDKFWENYIKTRPADSKGAFDAFRKMSQEPRTMAQGGRIGFADGKIVLSKEKFIELIEANKNKTYNEFVEILNKKYTTKDGRVFTRDIVADRAREANLSGTLQLEPAKGRSEESKAQRREAEKKRYHEMRKTEEGRAKQKEWRVKAKAKEYKLKGMDPPATNANESLWKDIVKTAKENTDGKGRFSIKGYKKSMKSKDFFSNKITITDNVTGKTFTYNNMKNYINKNAKSFDIKGYDEAIKSHKQKWFINDTPNLRNNINIALIPGWTPDKSQTAITIQHDVGRQKNPLKTSIAFWDANKTEYDVRTNFEKAWEKAKKSKTPLKAKKKAFNVFKADIEKLNIKSQPAMVKRLRSFGTELSLEDAIKIAKQKGAVIPHGTLTKARNIGKIFKNVGINLNAGQIKKAQVFLRSALNKGQDISKFLPLPGRGGVAALDYGLFHYLFGVPSSEAALGASGWLTKSRPISDTILAQTQTMSFMDEMKQKKEEEERIENALAAHRLKKSRETARDIKPFKLDFSLPEEFAGGGMAGIRRPSAIPPESGPQPQGLASLKKYGSYY